MIMLCKKCNVDKPLTTEHWKPNKSTVSGWQLTQCRICFNEYYKARVKANPEQRREKERKYAENNPEKYAEKQKRHHDKQREQGKNKYCNRNLENVRKYERDRKLKPERAAFNKTRWERRKKNGYNDRSRELYAINPMTRRLTVNARRVRSFNAKGSHTLEQFMDKLKYHGFKCVYCKCDMTINTVTEDHRIPLFRGGTDFIANIVPACRSCNSSKGTKTDTEYRLYLKGVVI